MRFSVDETIGQDGVPIHGERCDMFEILAELPDLWDINIADYSLEMGISRFVKEAPLEPYMDFVKSVTSEPVVTVGRFTSPDTMADQIRRGVVDLIGAERIKQAGGPVTLRTPSESVSPRAGNTSERWRIRTHVMQLGIDIVLSHSLADFDGRIAALTCEYTGAQQEVPVASVVMVTQHKPKDGLYHDILAKVSGQLAALPFTLRRIGDCDAPAIIAAATYAGHRYARELDAEAGPDRSAQRDRGAVPVSLATSPAGPQVRKG